MGWIADGGLESVLRVDSPAPRRRAAPGEPAPVLEEAVRVQSVETTDSAAADHAPRPVLESAYDRGEDPPPRKGICSELPHHPGSPTGRVLSPNLQQLFGESRQVHGVA
jgi:hypothetical protein